MELWLDKQERTYTELQGLKRFSERYPDRPLSSVTSENLEAALSFCKTAGTYTRHRTRVMAILNLAKGRDWITKLPMLAQRKDKKKKPRKWITQEQWKALHAELPAHMQPMAEFAVCTGLRQSNVLGLTWNRVDLNRSFVWVEAEDMKDDDALPVPLSKRAVAILRAQKPPNCSDTHCFTYKGKPVSEIKTAFIAACIRAGLGSYILVDGRLRYQGFTWHGLRHSWATWHAQNETPLDVLQKLGGWADQRMVANYSHHTAGRLASYAENTRPHPGRARRAK